MNVPDRNAIAPLARGNGEPAFEAPWQAHVLAVAFALTEQGLFSRGDWASALGAELNRRSARGEPDSLHTYYSAALCALESLVTNTGAVSNDGLEGRTEVWRRAYLNTPHGKPVGWKTALEPSTTAGRDPRRWPTVVKLKRKSEAGMQNFLTRSRRGPRPRTTSTNPHTQLDQNAPVTLQEELFELGKSLAGVEVGKSLVSVPGARAFHLPGCTGAHHGSFMVECEFAHLHPPHDGSLHMTLPPDLVDRVIANGWAELHPLAGRYGLPANIVMVYGPRDEEELAVVADLLRASHARGLAAHRSSG